jgi:hypothetical protein
MRLDGRYLLPGGQILIIGGTRMSAELEAKRARLSLVERELSQLGTRHDLAMSAFRFDEARNLQQRITLLEHERAELIAVLPAPTPPPPTAPARVAVRPNRRRRPRHR